MKIMYYNIVYFLRTFFCLCLVLCFDVLFCQVKILSSNDNGTLSLLSLNDCSEESYLSKYIFNDIAFTPNNELYGINGALFKIDYLNNSCSYVGPITDSNNRLISWGTGLVALDNNSLLMDFHDSLYKISTTTAKAAPIGKIGYTCAGDFAILNDTLYMSDWNQHLIKIILDSSKTFIVSVKDVGRLKTDLPNIYSLFTAYSSCTASSNKELFAIVKNGIYKINPQTAFMTLVCSIANSSIESYGATSSFESNTNVNFSDRIPNVFTPNGDKINDLFSFTRCDIILKTTIYNRWGNEVFNTEIQNHFWDGKTKGGVDCPEGAYFYMITTEQNTYKGCIQLMR